MVRFPPLLLSMRILRPNLYPSYLTSDSDPASGIGEVRHETSKQNTEEKLTECGNQEEEAEKLMTESFSKNFIDYEEYPQSADIQNRCVSMIGRLFHAPIPSSSSASSSSLSLDGGEGSSSNHATAIGTSCVGSSEAIMLAVLAMKKRWKNKRQAAGLPTDRPNIVMSSAVQVCWEKATRYFEIEEKLVYCSPERYVIDPVETVDLVDENTIGICAILGTTYTGEYEDVKGVNDLLVERGLDCPIHVDAASGGFVAPFVVPDLEWDFRCEKVVSINVSGHKVCLIFPWFAPLVWFRGGWGEDEARWERRVL